MTGGIYQAAMPILVANVAVGLSFFDRRLITTKVKHELATSGLSSNQQNVVAQMCSGSGILLVYFCNMMTILAAAILADQEFSTQWRIWVVGTLAITVILLVAHLVHIAVTVNLSAVDDRVLRLGVTLGTVLRIELLILNTIVFAELALALSQGPDLPHF